MALQIIAKNSSLVKRKKSHVEKFRKISIKGTGLAAWQEIKIAMLSLDQ